MVRVVPNKGGSQADDIPSTSGREYLAYFVHRLLEFRKPELESLAQTVGCKAEEIRWRAPAGDVEHSPFWYLTLPSEDAALQISKRMILTKMLVEVWGEGEDWADLTAAIQACPQEVKAPWLGPELTFRVVVESFGSSLPMDEQLELIKRLEFIPFKGAVRLRDPQARWAPLRRRMNGEGARGSLGGVVPARLYFGRLVGSSDRGVIDTYSLRRRRYLGPTSMDTEMALVMCNQGGVRRGSLVLDPYAGTGSILVAAAHFGAKVMGADIDIKVLREGKGGERLTIHSNFQQYGLRGPLDLVRLDTHRHPIRPDLAEVRLHAGRPQGQRAPIYQRKPPPACAFCCNPLALRCATLPYTQPYTLGECLRDLLELSARLLVVGGRLVYFLPATPETYDKAEIPQHPALELIANSEQILTTRYSRRLITMEKVRPYDAAAAAAYYASHPDPTMSIDKLHDIVYEQLPPQPPSSSASSSSLAAAAVAAATEGGGVDGGTAVKPRRRCRGKNF
ncbi:hypothetical protein VOLCADRAFT_62647 [Volvox carteri f. nagariensis]|uniref:Uncharacterized protein n=1 Tax=Volvox carteri f. nagariensis TaxID=3068 RepID=D8U1F2_VOLCA|nr:uncharacterized protein VOLCADRAFT_62647 [Volvox carteri f. nagariensis]EFJ46403.1 hypothetical protein VOLCADRAFT_62647 [Volvox carteri f. nagariensis]|eukprot:XP_002952556.1 hypothetical protein VOLCADRAFT_62647 [Volvox carteri f. nagariensis]